MFLIKEHEAIKMFSRFVLDINEFFFLDKNSKDDYDLDYYYYVGKTHIEKYIEDIDLSLRKYTEENILSADKIEENWFPQVKADVFLSHSRKDKKITIAFAGWLYKKFGLKCFVDSLVWNHANSLLDALNNKYSDKDINDFGMVIYSHDKCCKVSEHVNMILAMALLKMIENVETVFLVNGGHAINVVDNGEMEVTYSPWIFSEMIYAKLIRRRPLLVYRDYDISNKDRKIYKNMLLFESLIMQFPVDLNGMEHIDSKLLNAWNERWEYEKILSKINYPLDVLYDLTCYKNELDITHQVYDHVSREDINIIKEIYADKATINHTYNIPLMENLSSEALWDGCAKCPFGRRMLYGQDK